MLVTISKKVKLQVPIIVSWPKVMLRKRSDRVHIAKMRKVWVNLTQEYENMEDL